MAKKKKQKEEHVYLPGCEVKEAELRDLVIRIEQAIKERRMINETITELYQYADSLLYNPKVLREVIRMRTMDVNKRLTLENLMPFYMKAVEEACTGFSLGLLSFNVEEQKRVSANGKCPANS